MVVKGKRREARLKGVRGSYGSQGKERLGSRESEGAMVVKGKRREARLKGVRGSYGSQGKEKGG